MEIISRDEAERQGKRHYYTGKVCKRGHLAPRFVTNAACTQCQNRHVVHTLSAPNVATPPTPYAFPNECHVTPELLAYVHARVLENLERFASEYDALAPGRVTRVGEEPYHIAREVTEARKAARAAVVAHLMGAGWTQAAIDAAVRYV